MLSPVWSIGVIIARHTALVLRIDADDRPHNLAIDVALGEPLTCGAFAGRWLSHSGGTQAGDVRVFPPNVDA
jgi:hypothetical protein